MTRPDLTVTLDLPGLEATAAHYGQPIDLSGNPCYYDVTLPEGTRIRFVAPHPTIGQPS